MYVQRHRKPCTEVCGRFVDFGANFEIIKHGFVKTLMIMQVICLPHHTKELGISIMMLEGYQKRVGFDPEYPFAEFP